MIAIKALMKIMTQFIAKIIKILFYNSYKSTIDVIVK